MKLRHARAVVVLGDPGGSSDLPHAPVPRVAEPGDGLIKNTCKLHDATRTAG